eukprot:Rhum_TRINITY_DN8046_c0_g2::Rhum_TRINITY_DN8046_c0_g2_i1::g.25916::m.25916/K12573/rnr, vacB; ribonuclease R
MLVTRAAVAGRRLAAAVSRRWCTQAPVDPLAAYVDADYSLWREERDDVRELPTREHVSQTLLKVRFLQRLRDNAVATVDEAERLDAKIAELKERAMARGRISADQMIPSDATAESDKAALNVLFRFALRYGSLTQMTYEWLLSDILDVYGMNALDGAFLVRILTRSGLVDSDDNLVLTVNKKTLVPPDFLSQISFDGDHEDDCAHIREQVPERMYAIDDSSTFEVDDAISVGKDGWFSVHVADVSRYLPYESDVRVAAQALATTVYFPETILTMLPRALITVATLKAAPAESLVCSVAFKLDAKGTVVDRRMFVGTTRQCFRITYEQVNSYLKSKGFADYEDCEHVDLPAWFDEKLDGPALVSMHRTARMLREKRTTRGALMIMRPEWRPSVSKIDESEEAAPVLATDGNSHLIDVRLSKNLAFGSRKIVEEFMLLAGHSVATACEIAGVPCPYRVTHNDEIVDGEKVMAEEPSRGSSVLMPSPELNTTELENSPAAQFEQGSRLLRDQKSAFYSSKNLGHVALKTSYCHFTSPLRRYPDLLVHYHVKDYLRRQHEQASLEKRVGNNNDDDDDETVQEVLRKSLPKVCQKVTATTGSKKKMMASVNETWLIRDIERKLQEDPERQFEVYVGATYWVGASMEHESAKGTCDFCSAVVIADYGLLARVYHTGEYREGMFVQAHVRNVEPQTRYFELELLEPVPLGWQNKKSEQTFAAA